MQSAAPTVDEQERLQALRRLGILDSPPEASFDALVRVAAAVCGVPISAVSLIDKRRQWFKAEVGLGVRETPREFAFCAHAIHGSELFEVEDARSDPRFFNNPLVTGRPDIRFYAGQPLHVHGVNLGTLCVIDTEPHKLDARQRDMLRQLADAAAELLAMRNLAQALSEQQQRLLDYQQLSGDGMWETDAKLNYVFLSEGFAQATGLTSSAWSARIGQPLPNFDLLGEQGRIEPGGWHRLLAQGRPVARAVSELRCGDEVVHLAHTAKPLHDKAGKLAGWRGVSRNVSAQRRGGLSLRQEALLLARITAQVPGVIFRARRREADGLLQFLYLSPAATLLFGFSAEAACADPRLVFDRVHRDDLPRAMEELSAAQAGLSAWRSEYRVVLPGGRVRWVETRALPEQTDEGLLWNGFTADITERKTAELSLRQAEQNWELAAAADGIGVATVDLATGRVRFDRRACQNHGLAYPHREFVVNDWLAMVDEPDRASARAALERAIRQRTQERMTVRMQRADGGALRHLEFSVVADCDDGRPVRLAGTCRDVTERLEDERLAREKEAAERAVQAQRRFLSRASHELRTPLNSILGYAQLLSLDREHPLQPAQRRQMEIVAHAGHHLLGLIDDLLDLSRAQAVGLALSPRGIDLGAALSTCVQMVMPQARAAGVRMDGVPADSVRAQGNARAVEQVLMNLLSNAIKYNRRGGRVSFDFDRDAHHVRLSIHDEGPGLTPQQRARLFTPFDRLGAEGSAQPGSGLGLAIAHELAQAMGGSLRAGTRTQGGTTFVLELPGHEGGSASLPMPLDEAPAPPTRGAAASGPRRLLYIEDDPLNALLVREVVNHVGGWRIEVAVDGASGLQAARHDPPDLLLTDINLPDMSGIDIVRALRSDSATARLRCVALSADAMREQIDTAIDAGFDDYWLKPIDVREMAVHLARLAGTEVPGEG